MKASKKSKIKGGTQFYKVGDKVETIRTDTGAWFTAVIFDISPGPKCECLDGCQCTYKLLFEGSEDVKEMGIVERNLNEIRQVSYQSISWNELKVGMKVVINYNIEKPKQWGYWYDYIIEDIQKKDDVYFLKGTLLVGYDGSCKKIPVSIDSDNVADVLAIRPHATVQEKEMDSYETGVKPEYCKKCKNKPKVKCRTCCCCKCGMKKDFELTVQCDECADWYHFYCTKPPIQELPEDDDWYCPKCNNETRRSKSEMKLALKREKKSLSNEKKRAKDSKGTPRRLVKHSETTKTAQEVEKDCEDEDIEETKNVPEDTVIWNRIKELFPGYDVVRIQADVVKTREFGGLISGPAERFIKKDVSNERLWREAKKSLDKGKEAFLEEVKKIFTCAICCEVVQDPITLSCSHNFCIGCFFNSLSMNIYHCPLCRVDIIQTEHYTVNENLKGALELLFKQKKAKK